MALATCHHPSGSKRQRREIHYGMELVTGKQTLADLTSRLYTAVTFHELYRLAAEDGMNPAVGKRTSRERLQKKSSRV